MKRFLILLMALTLLCGMAAADSSGYDLTFADRELAGTWDAASAVTISGQGSTCDISGKGAALADGILTISAAGTYVLTGAFSDVCLVVNCGKNDKVQLVLNSADISSANGPAIYVKQADKVFLTAAKDTENGVSDGTGYTVQDGDTTLDAAIFSRADLCINGQGMLTVKGNTKHAIVSKDDLILTGLTLTVEAASTALDGKDCVMMSGVTATVTAGSNGIRSTNAEESGRGHVYIRDCTLSITAGTDGIQAATLLQADNATMTILTGGGSASAPRKQESFPGGGRKGFDTFSSATPTAEATATNDSCKALKAGNQLILNGGAYAIDSQDDCLHANGTLTITGGMFNMASGDDGIHADDEVLITGGEIIISRSYEGIEGSKVSIADGQIDITATDDGLNGAGGADGSATADRWGRGSFGSSTGEIHISGGYIHINAGGDGIDSNGAVRVSGGVTLVSCVNTNGNAAFDHDGQAIVSGGILIATGGNGMAQSFDVSEGQGCMMFSMNGQAGTSLAILDAEGHAIAAFTPVNSYSSVVLTAPALMVGSTYTVVSGAQVEGGDANGFAADAACSGGTTAGTIQMTTLLQGGSGHGFGGGRGTPGGWGMPGGWGTPADKPDDDTLPPGGGQRKPR